MTAVPLVPLAEAIATHVHDGDSVALEGFTHLIPFAAAHEIIRQRRQRLHLIRMTPDLVYDMEIACRNLLLAHGEPGKDSVGTRVEIDHLGATLLGMWAEITVSLSEVKGNAVSFEFTARDAIEEIARGRHNRYIVNIEKTAQRLKAKLAKAKELAATTS